MDKRTSLTVTLTCGSTPDNAVFLIGLDGFHYEGEGRIADYDQLASLITYPAAEALLDRALKKKSEAA